MYVKLNTRYSDFKVLNYFLSKMLLPIFLILIVRNSIIGPLFKSTTLSI